jgi:protein CpxP
MFVPEGNPMRPTPTRLCAAAAVLITLGATPCLAQLAPGQYPPGQYAPGQQAQPGQYPTVEQQMASLNNEIAQLRARLGVTPAEEPQWDAVAQAMRADTLHMAQAFQTRMQQRTYMNALEDLRSYVAMMRVHVADLQQLETAFAAFYARLSPPQRSVANSVFQNFEQGR